MAAFKRDDYMELYKFALGVYRLATKEPRKGAKRQGHLIVLGNRARALAMKCESALGETQSVIPAKLWKELGE